MTHVNEGTEISKGPKRDTWELSCEYQYTVQFENVDYGQELTSKR